VGRLLRAYQDGDRSAFGRVIPLVYDELRRLARRHLRRGPHGHTLDTTGLVHEAYLKLAAGSDLRVKDRGHLMAVTACAMRQVLVDRARARLRDKRGAGQVPQELDEARLPGQAGPEWLVDLDRALSRLQERDESLVRVFECRFFGGLSEEETAEALGISLRTAQRGWMRARGWLRSELVAGRAGPAEA
jgi:RNA polymerase sigma factor (TIGR02999 family)